MKPSLLVIAFPVCAAFAVSAILFAKEKTARSFIQLVGAGLLIVVELAHVAEELRLLQWMGWGLPNSIGHYVDLISAIAGLLLLSFGYLSRRLARRSNPN